jgi:DNA-binding CsgD family transcriptional regulator
LRLDIVLWRRPQPGPFHDRERILLRALGPHLNKACSRNALAYLSRRAGRTLPPVHCCAMADRHGDLRVVQSLFRELLLEEFPQWRGPRLPPVVLSALARAAAQGEARLVANRIVIRIHQCGDTYLLRCRRRQALDSLSPRELEVARMAAEGLEHRAIAARLAISTVTVRNHLNNILRKSQLRRRTEIAARLAELE